MGNYFSENSEQNSRIKKVLEELCPKYDAEENQILLAFILKHPSKILPVIGTSKAETIKKFKEVLNLSLEREDWFKLLKASQGKEVDWELKVNYNAIKNLKLEIWNLKQKFIVAYLISSCILHPFFYPTSLIVHP